MKEYDLSDLVTQKGKNSIIHFIIYPAFFVLFKLFEPIILILYFILSFLVNIILWVCGSVINIIERMRTHKMR